jgi:hypothetical protein
MNCQECREGLAAYLEGLLDATCQSQIDLHVAECAACQSELREVRELTVRLTRAGIATPDVSLETAVMDRIVHEQALLIRRLQMKKRIRVFGMSSAMVAAAALLFIGDLWLTQPANAQKAAETLARGAEAVPNPSTVHIVAKMRTLPADNFSYINADLDLQRIEIWKQFGDKPKWRVEKPGRVAVMDGASTVLLVRPTNFVVKLPQATGGAFDTGWMLGLTNVQDMITRELRAAQAKGWRLKTTEETTPAGEKQQVVTVEAKAEVSDNDWLKNKFFQTADTRRVYRFDAKTQRLEGVEAYLHQPGGDVLIFATERIEYDQPFDPTVFAVELPKNVASWKEIERLPDNEKYEKLTPRDAARAFFEACGKEDWTEAQKFFPMPLNEKFKSGLGGLKIVSLGEPFPSKGYAGGKGWFIPYVIKLRNGEVKKFNLAMRRDNPANRYVVDGGL